jgi:hypothetical protein
MTKTPEKTRRSRLRRIEAALREAVPQLKNLTDTKDALIRDWLSELLPPNLLFRVAVREVEAWLLGDRTNLARFLRVSPALIPTGPEALGDPKTALIALAAKSRRTDIRDPIVPNKGSTARQGRDYNGCLTEFVRGDWDIDSSSGECPASVTPYEGYENSTRSGTGLKLLEVIRV